MRRRNLILGGTLIALATALGVARSAREAGAQSQGAQGPRFEVDPLWPKPLPNHWILGSAVGVAVDARDHVFVLHLMDSFNQRTEIGLATNPPTGECCAPAPAVLEFDPDGNLVGHWGGPGEGAEWPAQNHGLTIDPQGNAWIGGSGGVDTRMLKFTAAGKLLAQIGKAVAPPAAPAAAPSGADTAYAGVSGRGAAGGRGGRGGGRGGRGAGPVIPPNSASTESFGGPAKIGFDGTEGFVADGYRNHRVAVVDPSSGAIKRFWGAYGKAPEDAKLPPYDPSAGPAKQFSTVTCAEPSKDGMVYVCDRGNDRIQVFKKDGSFVKEQTVVPATRGEGSVWDIAFSRDPQQKYLYVADGMNMKIHVLDRQTLALITSFGDGGRQPGEFAAVDGVATDSKGNLYTVEAQEGKRVQKFIYKGVGAVAKSQTTLWPARKGGDK